MISKETPVDATRPLPNGIGPPRSECFFANIHLISLHSEQKELVKALRALHSAIRVRIISPIHAEAYADHADCRGYSARLRTQFLDTGTPSVPLSAILTLKVGSSAFYIKF